MFNSTLRFLVVFPLIIGFLTACPPAKPLSQKDSKEKVPPKPNEVPPETAPPPPPAKGSDLEVLKEFSKPNRDLEAISAFLSGYLKPALDKIDTNLTKGGSAFDLFKDSLSAGKTVPEYDKALSDLDAAIKKLSPTQIGELQTKADKSKYFALAKTARDTREIGKTKLAKPVMPDPSKMEYEDKVAFRVFHMHEFLRHAKEAFAASQRANDQSLINASSAAEKTGGEALKMALELAKNGLPNKDDISNSLFPIGINNNADAANLGFNYLALAEKLVAPLREFAGTLDHASRQDLDKMEVSLSEISQVVKEYSDKAKEDSRVAPDALENELEKAREQLAKLIGELQNQIDDFSKGKTNKQSVGISIERLAIAIFSAEQLQALASDSGINVAKLEQQITNAKNALSSKRDDFAQIRKAAAKKAAEDRVLDQGSVADAFANLSPIAPFELYMMLKNEGRPEATMIARAAYFIVNGKTGGLEANYLAQMATGAGKIKVENAVKTVMDSQNFLDIFNMYRMMSPVHRLSGGTLQAIDKSGYFVTNEVLSVGARNEYRDEDVAILQKIFNKSPQTEDTVKLALLENIIKKASDPSVNVGINFATPLQCNDRGNSIGMAQFEACKNAITKPTYAGFDSDTELLKGLLAAGGGGIDYHVDKLIGTNKRVFAALGVNIYTKYGPIFVVLDPEILNDKKTWSTPVAATFFNSAQYGAVSGRTWIDVKPLPGPNRFDKNELDASKIKGGKDGLPILALVSAIDRLARFVAKNPAQDWKTVSAQQILDAIIATGNSHLESEIHFAPTSIDKIKYVIMSKAVRDDLPPAFKNIAEDKIRVVQDNEAALQKSIELAAPHN